MDRCARDSVRGAVVDDQCAVFSDLPFVNLLAEANSA